MNADELTVPDRRDAQAEYYHARSLYELQDEFASLLARVEAAGGELDDETSAALDINESEFTHKAGAYAMAIRSLEAFAAQCLAEVNRIRERMAAAENTADRLKDKLRDALIARGGMPVDCGTFRLSLRKSSAVDVVDEAAIPAEFRVVKTVESVDKTAIKDAIKSGKEVPGATVVERKNLQIK